MVGTMVLLYQSSFPLTPLFIMKKQSTDFQSFTLHVNSLRFFRRLFLYACCLCLLPGTYAQLQLGADIDGEAEFDGFGNSVSISSDGSRIAVGASGGGYVRVFDWNGATWVQVGANIDGEAALDNFGRDVSLSADGNRLAVGAISNDATDPEAGYARVFDWNGSAWVQAGSDIDGETADDKSGWSVSLSANGSRLAVGAPDNDGTDINAGHVRVYDWNGTVWIQVGADIDGEAGDDRFGSAVSFSADGNRLAVGARRNNGTSSNAGHVRVYDWNGTAWVQAGADIDGISSNDNFGISVSFSADGSRLAVGARDNGGEGYVRIYDWNGAAWVQAGSDIDGEASGDQFGIAVSLSSDGSRLVAGGNSNDDAGNFAGHARAFDLAGLLPTGITSTDIGDVSGTTGTVYYDGGVYTVTTSGRGIKGTADGFHYISQSHTGDIDMIVRVTGIQNNSNRQAGLMLRDGKDADAAHVSLIMNGQKQLKLLKRGSKGGTTATAATKVGKKRVNLWLRLSYSSTTHSVVAYQSRTGVSNSWIYVGTTHMMLPGTYEAGIAASKGGTGNPKVFTFDNFSINGTAYRFADSDVMNQVTIIAYPNPFGDQLAFQVEGVAVGTHYQVSLLDLTGRVITAVEALDSNASTAVINTQEIAAGIYFLEVRTADARKRIKVVKK